MLWGRYYDYSMGARAVKTPPQIYIPTLGIVAGRPINPARTVLSCQTAENLQQFAKDL